MRVAVHILEAVALAPFGEKCRVLVAPRYERASHVGPHLRGLEELACGMLLRDVLGVTADDQLIVSPQGKPSLAGGLPFFNLSNECGLAVLATCDEGPVGVDVEPICDHVSPARRRLGEKLFSPDVDLDDPEAFARAWTRLEAAVKADGCGLAAARSALPAVVGAWSVRHLAYRDAVIAVATSEPAKATVTVHDAADLLSRWGSRRTTCAQAGPSESNGLRFS